MSSWQTAGHRVGPDLHKVHGAQQQRTHLLVLPQGLAQVPQLLPQLRNLPAQRSVLLLQALMLLVELVSLLSLLPPAPLSGNPVFLSPSNLPVLVLGALGVQDPPGRRSPLGARLFVEVTWQPRSPPTEESPRGGDGVPAPSRLRGSSGRPRGGSRRLLRAPARVPGDGGLPPGEATLGTSSLRRPEAPGAGTAAGASGAAGAPGFSLAVWPVRKEGAAG